VVDEIVEVIFEVVAVIGKNVFKILLSLLLFVVVVVVVGKKRVLIFLLLLLINYCGSKIGFDQNFNPIPLILLRRIKEIATRNDSLKIPIVQACTICIRLKFQMVPFKRYVHPILTILGT
jgi:hypothetical protein